MGTPARRTRTKEQSSLRLLSNCIRPFIDKPGHKLHNASAATAANCVAAQLCILQASTLADTRNLVVLVVNSHSRHTKSCKGNIVH